jgi:hypothetical protein
MSIIEQLGGYADAKDILRRSPFDLSQEELKALQKAGVLNTFGLEKVLLEYRRDNGIFEVGDKVVFNQEKSDDTELLTVNYVLDDGSFLGINDYRQAFPSTRFTHATDAERQAGKRLPQLEVLNDIDIPPNTIILGDK